MRERNSGRRGRVKEWKQKGISLRDCGLFFLCVCVKHYNSFFDVSTKKKKKAVTPTTAILDKSPPQTTHTG